MKIYHVKTQEDYDALMRELKKEGYGQVVFFTDAYHIHEDDTHIIIDDSRDLPLELTYSVYVEDWYKDVPIQEYKAKGNGYKASEYVCMPRKRTLSKAINEVGEEIAERQRTMIAEAMNSNNNVQSTMETVSQDDAELFHKIITDLEQTYIAKNKDYGNSFEESLNEFGEIAGIVRIGDKFNRIKSLSKTEEVNVKDESKIDTLLDMANYCIMQAKWLMK